MRRDTAPGISSLRLSCFPSANAARQRSSRASALRYTTATVLHELSCDDTMIGHITGHETLAIVKKYRAKRRRVLLAIARLNRACGTPEERYFAKRR
jgi:hypothetical protein